MKLVFHISVDTTTSFRLHQSQVLLNIPNNSTVSLIAGRRNLLFCSRREYKSFMWYRNNTLIPEKSSPESEVTLER